MTEERINFGGWPNCIRMSNGQSELIMTTDVGPRIIRFGFINKQNFFYAPEEEIGKTGGEAWRIYGGHRLWLAPEMIPRTFYPDNDRINYRLSSSSLIVTQPAESTTGIVKEMEISLALDKNEVTVLHRLIHKGAEVLELAPWALSVLAPGGRAIAPQEPFGEGDDFLLPARPLALWHYTTMNDPRWIWGERYIQARQLESSASEQKVGILNKQGWIAYFLNNEAIIKHFGFEAGAVYPDFGCNNEIYINGKFLEVETLGPLIKLAPGESVEHKERWLLTEVSLDESEASIAGNLLPIVKSFIASDPSRDK